MTTLKTGGSGEDRGMRKNIYKRGSRNEVGSIL